MGMDVVKLILPNRSQIQFQIALVDEPAIESDFMAFNSHNHFQFKEVDKKERLLMGYFMIADMEILRMDAKRGAYKVVFPKESIDTIVENFSLNGLNKNMNEMHNTGQLLDGVFVRSYWQIDSAKGIVAPKGFKTEADGSWFGIVKCENDEIYQKALDGTFRGFSIEGRFIEEAVDKYLKTDNTKVKFPYNKFKNMNVNLKEAFDAFVEFFSKSEVSHKFEELLLADGTTKVTIEPEVAVGSAIALYDAEGNPIPAPVGSYELQDGRIIVVEVDGVIAAIQEPTPEGEEMEDEKKPQASAAGQEAVKRLIERIEKVSEFESQIAELKTELAESKTEKESLKSKNEELEKKFSAIEERFNASETKSKELEKMITENFQKLLAQDSKKPVIEQQRSFKLDKKKESIYPFLKQ